MINKNKAAFAKRYGRGLGIIGLAVWALFLSACSSLPKDTYYCRDENGKPVEGVLLICRYSGSTGMSYFTAGADYRFSDSNGRADFGDDEITRKLISGAQTRSITYVYSPRLRSGGGIISGYKKNNPTPGATSYATAERGVIAFRNNTHDPAIWFWALYYLTEEAHDVLKRMGGYETNAGYRTAGIDELAAMLGPFVDKEWASFFKQYGNEPIPMDYFNKWFHDVQYIRPQSGVIKFNDLKGFVAKARYE